MTENRIYSMSADLFDNSSNSSNLLKLDIFPSDFLFGSGSNSNSNSSLGLSTVADFVARNRPLSSANTSLPAVSIITATSTQTTPSTPVGSSITTLLSSALSPTINLNQCTNISTTSSSSLTSNTSSSSMDNLRDNPMLNSTASMSIPQRSNGGVGVGVGVGSGSNHSNNSNNLMYHNQSRILADFSEYGLDVLDASSLSPTYVQESNLSLTPHSNTSSSLHGNYNGLLFINNASSSPVNISQSSNAGNNLINNNNNINNNNIHNNNNNNNNNHSNNNNNSGQTINTLSLGGSSNSNSNSLSTLIPNNGDLIVYEIPTVGISSNSNSMWSEIGNAMITTKVEPFAMDEDYIFQLDKADLMHSPTLAELNDETLLEDLNIDDLIQAENDASYYVSHGQLHQLQSVNSSGLLSQQQHNVGGDGGSSSSSSSNTKQHENQMHSTSVGIPMQSNQNNYNVISAGKFIEDQNTCSSSSPYDIQHSTPIKGFQHSNAAFSPGSQTSSSPLLMQSLTPPASHLQYMQKIQQQPQQNNLMPQKHSSSSKVTPIHELALKHNYSQSPDRSSLLGQSVPGPSSSHMLISGGALSPVSSGFGSISGQSSSRKLIALSSNNGAGGSSSISASRLSSSAPTHLHLDEMMQQRRSDFPFDHPIWRRREPRQHLLSTGSSIAEADSISSLSTTSILSPEHDEGYSDYDSDHSEDYSSDNGSDNDDDTLRGSGSSSKNKERYFWQYNVQAKGPKGQRLVIKTQLEDPHVLNEVTDPVFSPNCSVRGIKHSGKARKGDGNDLTPNPRKLFSIGKELDKLGRQINDMPPVSELPTNTRQKTRKEKNKLASRACRLKKKAQHEANKIKLYGLELEHKKLLNGIMEVKNCLALKYQNQNPTQMNRTENNDELNNQIERIATTSTTIQIAGSSTEFVNTILDKVKSGLPSGGLEDLKGM